MSDLNTRYLLTVWHRVVVAIGKDYTAVHIEREMPDVDESRIDPVWEQVEVGDVTAHTAGGVIANLIVDAMDEARRRDEAVEPEWVRAVLARREAEGAPAD